MVDGARPLLANGFIASSTFTCAHWRTSSSETAPLRLRSVASPSRHWVRLCVAKPPMLGKSQETSL
jgi:hypothetical protein